MYVNINVMIKLIFTCIYAYGIYLALNIDTVEIALKVTN